MMAELVGGNLAALIRDRDWSRTSLGAMARWPAWLKSAVDVCLGSGFPIGLFIGKDYIHIYNDRFAEIIGDKHPDALGRPCHEVYPEICETVRPLFDHVMAGGDPIRREDHRVYLRRGSDVEECYLTFSHGALPDGRGGIGGVFCICTETTARVVGERRMRTLYDLASECVAASSDEEVGRVVERVLAQNRDDLPFALLYRLSEEAGPPRRLAMVRLERDAPELWSGQHGTRSASWWRRSGLKERLRELGLPRDLAADEVVVVTMRAGHGRPGAMLVAGRNPFRPFNMEYLSFLRLILGQIAGELGSVQAYENQRRRMEDLAALEQERRRYSTTLQTVLESLSGAIACFDRDWNCTFINDEALTFFGTSREETIGRNLWEGWPVLKETPLHAAAMRAVAEGGPVRIEWLCPLTRTWLETRILAGPTMISLSSVDIADRRQAEQMIRLRVREQEAVARFGHRALLDLDIEALMREAVRLVAGVLEVPRAAVVEIQRGRKDRLLVRTAHGFGDGLSGLRLKRGSASLSGYTLETGRPVVIQDLAEETRFESLSLRAWGIVSALSVIIEGPDRTPYGVLLAASAERHEFQRSAVAFMESMANILGAAIQRRHAEDALAQERAQLEVRVRERTRSLRSANDRLCSLSRRLIEVQEQERRHIARELHDEIGQNLTVLKMNLLGLVGGIPDERAAARLREDLARLEELLAQIRNLSLDLGPSSLDDLGLVAALRGYARRIATRTGLDMSFRVIGEERRLAGHIETAAFRISQEAITNVIRHSRAARLHVEVRFGKRTLIMTVQDDGIGFDADAVLDTVEEASSAGLLGMQERARLAGGVVEIASEPGAGTTVRARFPIRASLRKEHSA